MKFIAIITEDQKTFDRFVRDQNQNLQHFVRVSCEEDARGYRWDSFLFVFPCPRNWQELSKIVSIRLK